jgi:hypothetical protein
MQNIINIPNENVTNFVLKIRDFHGYDYEAFRLLGYRNPFHTSQETHYVSVTEPSRLMLCKFYGGDYEEHSPLECFAALFL